MEAQFALVTLLLLSGQPDAAKITARAVFKSQGYDVQLRVIERHVFSDDQRYYLGIGGALARVAVEQRVTISWRFP